jgi:hypothetical protein
MNKETRNKPVQPTLETMLGRVPKDARAWYKHELGGYEHIPYGRLIQEALAEIERLKV